MSTAVSQDKVITERDFHVYLIASRSATGDVPFRKKENIETGNRAIGPWKLHGTSIQEAVPPDRFHTTYSSGQPPESVHIGTSFYTKQPDGTWPVKITEYRAIMPPPAALHRFTHPVESYTETRGDGGTICVTVVTRPTSAAANETKNAFTYIYKFDRQGALFEKDSISFNGYNWIKYTHRFEYDPTINIFVPPVK